MRFVKREYLKKKKILEEWEENDLEKFMENLFKSLIEK